MSDKFFFKGKKEKKPKHNSYGFNTKRSIKSGTKDAPFELVVTSEERKLEVEALVAEHKIFVSIEVNAEKEEDIVALEGFLNKPKTTTFDKKPNRNDPCTCGSGKKYKKCCA